VAEEVGAKIPVTWRQENGFQCKKLINNYKREMRVPVQADMVAWWSQDLRHILQKRTPLTDYITPSGYPG
jgi:hypothetical protein